MRPQTPLSADELRARLENYCVYRERCIREVRQKLKELGASRQIAEQIEAYLQEEGFLNEARFALAFAGSKFRANRWGRVRIRQELRMRDIPPALVQEALDSIDEDAYLELVEQVTEKKKAQYDGDPNAREKTAAALMRMGFESELIFRYL